MSPLRKVLSVFIPVFLISTVVWFLYRYNFISHREYAYGDFDLSRTTSGTDFDRDSKDDQQDILDSAREYARKKPAFDDELKFYDGGWPTGNSGRDVDVVNYALKGAGVDLQKQIKDDYSENPTAYKEENMTNLDSAFRINENVITYLDRYFLKETTDIYKINEWKGGDIVAFSSGHVAVVSDIVNGSGISWIIHHYSKFQLSLEQDALELPDWGEVTGHYRIGQGALSISRNGRVKK